MQSGSIVAVIGVLAILGSACSATVGTGPMTSVPSDAPATCATMCKDVGMSLAQLVVMANEVGCVCNVKGTSASSESGAPPGAAGGMAAVLAEREAARRQAAQQPAH